MSQNIDWKQVKNTLENIEKSKLLFIFKCKQDIKSKNRIKNILQKRDSYLDNIRNIRKKKKAEICIFSCIHGIKMRRSTRDEQQTGVWWAKK